MGNDISEAKTSELKIHRLKILLGPFTIGIWIAAFLYLIGIQLGYVSDIGYLYRGVFYGVWKSQNYYEIYNPLLIILVLTLVSIIVELSFWLLKGSQNLNQRFLLLAKSLLMTVLSLFAAGSYLFYYFPVYSGSILFLVIILFYTIIAWLLVPERQRRIKQYIDQSIAKVKNPIFSLNSGISPILVITILLVPALLNWRFISYISTFELLSGFMLILTMLLILGVNTHIVVQLIVKVVGTSETRKINEVMYFALFSICYFEVAQFYSLEIRSYLYIMSIVLLSYPLANRVTGRIRARTNYTKYQGNGWIRLSTSFAKSHRFNVITFVVGILILSSVFIIPRETIAFFQPQSSGVRVGIIDTGILSDDPYLRHSIVQEKSFVTSENGFASNETNPQPLGISPSHGTLVAHCLTEVYPNASIVSAKIANASDYITKDAILEAIDWCIEEAAVSVISISLNEDYFDVTDSDWSAVFELAWNSGVVVVIAAGNNQPYEEDYVYSTIGILGQSPYVITVGAAEFWDVAWYSGRGPNIDGLVKPDILADGMFEGIRGTSFAAPRVAGGAAVLIEYLQSQGLSWSPGLIKAALMNGAISSSAKEYEAGAGYMSIENSLDVIMSAPISESNSPKVMSILPTHVPLDYDRFFGGVNYSQPIQVFLSESAQLDVNISSDIQDIVHFDIPLLSQFGLINMTISPLNSTIEEFYRGHCNFTWNEITVTLHMSFVAEIARAKIGLITCYDTRNFSTRYWQYSRLVRILADAGIASFEVARRNLVTTSFLAQFDGLIVLDPFVTFNSSIDYHVSNEEIDAIRQFSENGGGILTAVSESDASTFNSVFSWSGLHLQVNRSFVVNYVYPEHRILAGLEDDILHAFSFEPRCFNISSSWEGILRAKDIEQRILDEPATFNVTVLTDSPSRLLFHGLGEWFTNQYIASASHDTTKIVLRMCKWVLGLY